MLGLGSWTSLWRTQMATATLPSGMFNIHQHCSESSCTLWHMARMAYMNEDTYMDFMISDSHGLLACQVLVLSGSVPVIEVLKKSF